MAAPTPLTGPFNQGVLVQKTSVSTVNTWEKLVGIDLTQVLRDLGEAPWKIKMQNTGVTDIKFGIRLANGQTPATATAETIIMYEAILPGSNTTSNGGKANSNTNKINFSTPMHENTYTNMASDEAYHDYINGSSTFVEIDCSSFVTSVASTSIEIYVDTLNGWIASAPMTYNPTVTNAIQGPTRGIRLPTGTSSTSRG